MNALAPPSGTLAYDLFTFLDNEFAPDSSAALLLTLCALSGRTGQPVSARTVGNGRIHTDIAMTIESLMTRDDAIYVTVATEAGIVSLGKPSGPRTLLYEGPLVDPQLRRTLTRLACRQPLRSFDAPLGQQDRFRTFDDPAAVILFDTDDTIADPGFNSTIPIKLVDGDVVRQQDGQRRLISFSQQGPAAIDAKQKTTANLAARLKAVNWKSRVIFDAPARVLAEAKHTQDVIRIEQLLSLASVREILVHEPSALEIIPAQEQSVAWIINQLDSVKTEGERHWLPLPAKTFLRQLQDYDVRQLPKAKEAQQASGVTAAAPAYVRFSRFDLATEKPFATLAGDRIDHLLRMLEKRGMVEQDGKERRRTMWRLTPWGSAFSQELLADRLRRMWQLGDSVVLGGIPRPQRCRGRTGTRCQPYVTLDEFGTILESHTATVTSESTSTSNPERN